MRMIGHVSSETDARTFSDVLFVRGVESQVEMERGSGWAVWVHSEDEVENARMLLQEFLYNPAAQKFNGATAEAYRLREKEAKSMAQAAKRTFDADRLFTRPMILGMTPITAGLVGICVVVWILSLFPQFRSFMGLLLISQYEIGNTPIERLTNGLLEIKRGQVWRLVTPILMHDSGFFLHILFNMFWLKDLGTQIEARRGAWFFIVFVLLVGAVSNLGQYAMTGPLFLGMSGVVYGLLGYIWIKGKSDPDSGFFIHPTIVTMMLIWLVVCYTGILGIGIANTAHTVGLIAGMLWGLLPTVWRK